MDREEALQKALFQGDILDEIENAPDPRGRTILYVQRAFRAGFDAASQPQWKRISDDGLPEADGNYLVAIKSPAWSVHMYVIVPFAKGEWVRDSNVVAWLPIPEYTGEV